MAEVVQDRLLTLEQALKRAAEVARELPRVSSLPSYQRSQAHHLILFAQAAGNGRVLGTDTKSF